jgi:tetratricopeptide (TPR) repeat protein
LRLPLNDRPYATAHVSELDSIAVTDTLIWRPVRRRFGIEAFGVNAYTAANPGDEIVEDHTEETYRHQELYFVAEGHTKFTVGGEEIDAPAGTFIFIRDPATRRHAVATEPGSTVLAMGGRPGEPFQESAWEYYMAASPYARTKDYDRALEVVQEGLERHPDNGSLLYNVACFEALAGRRKDALAHLRRAFELEPKAREWAQSDSDLDPIRDDPEYPS